MKMLSDDITSAITTNNIHAARELLQDYTEITYELANFAVQYGNLDIIELLFNAVKDKSQVIIMAVQHDRLDVIRYAADIGYSVESAIFPAATAGHLPITQFIVELNRPCRATHTNAMYGALAKNHLAVAKLLFDAGATFTLSSPSLRHILGGCIRDDWYETTMFILGTTLPATYLNEGLAIAITYNKPSYVTLFQNHGANIMQLPPDCMPNCCLVGNYDAVKMLLHLGYDLNGYYGLSAMYYAVYMDHCDIVELLITNGIDIHARPFSFLRDALAANSTRIVSLLLDRGYDITRDNDALLIVTVKNNNIQMLSLLLEYGADVGGCAAKLKKIIAKRNCSNVMLYILDNRIFDIDLNEMFLSAAKYGSYNVIELVHARCRRYLDMEAGLVTAANNGNSNICKFILNTGILIDEDFVRRLQCGYHTTELLLTHIRLPIFTYIEQNDIDKLNLLISTGTDITAYDNAYLFFAVKANLLSMSQLLITSGATVPPDYKKTWIFIGAAVQTDNVDLTKLVLRVADADAVRKVGTSTYFPAGDSAMIKLLQQYKLPIANYSTV